MIFSNRLNYATRIVCLFCVTVWTFSGVVHADVWEGAGGAGAGDGTSWTDGNNWDTTTVPGTGDTATFTGAASGTIDLGVAAVTIDHLDFSGVDVATGTYTIGTGTETLNFDNNGGIDTASAVAGNQTIGANVVLGDGAANSFRIDTESTTNRVIITGNIDTGSGAATAGVQRLEVGDLNGASGGKTVQIDGSISNNGDATRLDFFVGGADLELNGVVDTAAGGNTMRTIIRDTATATVGATGAFGRGTLDVRNGTLNLNTDLQKVDNNLVLGDTGNQAGDATVNIGAGNTLQLSTAIVYEDWNNGSDTSVASINGGTIQITGATRTIIAHNNTQVASGTAELTITSNIVNDGTDRDLFIRGADNEAEGGTVRFDGTNTSGAVTVQTGTLQLGHATGSLDDDFLTLSARNNAATVQGTTATVDLMGNDAHITSLNFGANGTENIAGTNGFTGSVVDSVGGGTLTVNNITYNDGAVGKENGAAVVSANINIDGNRTWTINDNAAIASTSAELTVSGNVTDDNNTRDIITQGDGTLAIGGNNTHDRTTLQNQRVNLETGTAFGTGDGTGVGSQDGRVFLQHYNGGNAAIYDGAVTLDISGQEVILTENLVIGGGSTNNVANLGSHQIIDTAGGGVLVFSGTTNNNENNLNNNVGSAGFENRTAIISADIRMENSGMTITANDAADDIDIDISGTISDELAGGVRTLVKNGAGTLRLSATNNDFGELVVQRGRLIITNEGAVGGGDITLGNNNTDATLEYTGGEATITNQFRVGDNNAAAGRTGDGTIANNGSGTLTLSNANFNQSRPNVTEARTLTLDGTADGVISGAIIDNNTVGGGTIGITKIGTNTWTLNGDNTYTGDTAVNAGQLNIAGTNTSNITVAAGANLGGEGSTTGNLVFSGTTHTLDIDATTAAALGSTGTGSLNVSALNVGGFTINVNGTGAGAVDVLTYGSGGFIGGLDRFAVGTAPTASARTGGTGVFADSGTAITFDLGFEEKIWQGTDVTNPSFWDIGTTGNWSAGSDALFFDGDSVIFGDSASDFTPTLQASGTVGNITINSTNTANDYTINDNGGGETINLTGTLTIANGDATTTNDGNDVVINATIAGTGSVFIGDNNDGVQDASQNSVTISGTNTYSGGTIIDEGRLAITNASALGTGTITIRDGENGVAGTNRDSVLDLDIASGFNVTNDFVISGVNGGKTIRFDNAGSNVGELSGAISNAETKNNFRIETGFGDALTLSGEISGTGAVTTKGVAGSGVVLGNAGNSFTGQLVVASDVSVASIGNAGVASHAGAGSQIILGISGGTGAAISGNKRDGNLIYTGSGDSTDKQVQVGNFWFTAGQNHTNGGAITNNGTGGLVFTNSTFSTQESRVAADIGARTLTLGGSYTGVNEIQGAILDNNATDAFVDETVGVTVDTDGTWALSGANTYTGATTITNGTLQLGNGGTTGSLSTSSTIVNNGTLAFNQTDTVTQGTDFSGSAISGTGAVTQNGSGTVTLNAANTYTGTTTIAAGTLQTDAADVAATSGALGNGGDITFTGGTLQYTANSAGTDYSTRIKNSTAAVAIDTNGQSVTLSGVIDATNTGGLTKSGAGTLELTAENTYSGNTTVSAGTLAVNNTTGSGTGTGDVSIEAGATLTGTGTIGGDTTISGVHSPGNSPGLQSFAGNLDYAAGASLTWELVENSDTGVRGTDYDGINVAGILTIDATATSDLIFNGVGSNVDFNDVFWDEDQSWQVFIAGTFSGPGVFSVQSVSTDSNGLALAANRGFFAWNAVGNDVFLEYTAVPEPSSFALLSLGLIGLGIHRRRKNRADQPEDSKA